MLPAGEGKEVQSMKQFNVTGMTCSACSAHVEKAVRQVEGVDSVSVNLLGNSMLVEYGGKTRPDIYLEAARRLGTVPAETVVFEDALHAARTAYEAGFRVCGVWDVSAEEDQAALKALADWYVRDLGDWVP